MKLPLFFLAVFSLSNSLGQSAKNLSLSLQVQSNITLQDNTKGNNPWSLGIGLQSSFLIKSKVHPTIELTGDLYLADDKVLRADSTGRRYKDVRSMANLFFGASLSPARNIYFSLLCGPSFISKQLLFGLKPSVGIFFSKKQKMLAKLSYITVFNRGNVVKQNFNSISISLGLKLY